MAWNASILCYYLNKAINEAYVTSVLVYVRCGLSGYHGGIGQRKGYAQTVWNS
jgi:hypothetical protein